MAYARPFGQTQAASPWSSGVPPGLQQPPQQQQQPAAVAQQMFSQPMGAFDLSGAFHGGQAAPVHWQQQPMQAAAVQFVPNSAGFMQQQPIMMPVPVPMQQQQQQQPQRQQRFQQHQQQRGGTMHQRSLSAPRIGGNQNVKRGNNGQNQNNSFGGGQQRQQQANNNNNNNNNSQQQQQRTARQGNQKVQFNTNNNANSQNAPQQNQQKQQQQQQSAKVGAARAGPTKVTKAAKKQALAKANKGAAPSTPASQSKANKATVQAAKAANASASTANVKAKSPAKATSSPAKFAQNGAAAKPLSKTAERKQLKLQARKNAEALKESKLPVVKSTRGNEGAESKDEQTLDQFQLKCVPAVFGFVCKACDVFLRDRAARIEHIESDDHKQRYTTYEAELAKAAAAAIKVEQAEQAAQVEQTKPQAESNNNESEVAEVKPADVNAAGGESTDAQPKPAENAAEAPVPSM